MSEFPKEARPWALSPRGMFTLAGSLVVLVGLAIGTNVGGLRERLFGRMVAPRIGSIAVLPFENLSHDPAQDYIADGVAAGLRDRLAQIGAVRVIAAASVVQYEKAPKPLPEVALELNVDAVIQGSVRRSGDSLQTAANLVHAPTRRRLWGRSTSWSCAVFRTCKARSLVEQRGRFDDAIVELQKVVVDWGGAVSPTAALWHACVVAGREAEAREVLDKLLARSKTEYVSAYEIATVYAGLGDRERAFEWLEEAYEERSNALARFRMDPRLRSLQSDARFQELLRRMNFPQAGQN